MKGRMANLQFNEHARRLHKWRNFVHSALLLGGMGLVLSLCAFGLFGADGVVAVLVGGTVAAIATPRIGPEWVIKAHKGTRLTRQNFPQAVAIVEALAQRAELNHTPSLFYIPSRMLNAFATGSQDKSAIAITDGMLRRLSQRELVGVIAHEISHISNNDLWLMGLADLLSRITSSLSYFGIAALVIALLAASIGYSGPPLWAALLLIAAPTICSLLQLALSRAREYDADLEAATMTGDPTGLASALAKLERVQGRYWEEIMLPGRRMPDPSLLRTHPPTAERIARLQSLIQPEKTQDFGLATAELMPLRSFGEPAKPRFIWPGFWC